MSVFGSIYQSLVYRGWEAGLRRRPTFNHLNVLEKSQWFSFKDLRARQEIALARQLRAAYDFVPYYRGLFDERGITPADIHSAEELYKLPLLTKARARAAGDSRRRTVPPMATINKLTGGTTGEPLIFGFDPGSEYWRHANKLRGWGWAGYHVGERAFYYWGPAQTETPPWSKRTKVALDRFMKRERYVDCTRRGPQDLAAALRAFVEHRPSMFICYTQAGVDLARYIVDNNLRTWDDIAVLCCAERLDPHDRPMLERAFGPQVFETYGCREVMLIGTECEQHDGLHTSMENLIVELVVRDGENERPAKPGEVGEIVVTDLHNVGMPFIRYALGDLAVQGDETPCKCGRGLGRIRNIEGRTAETFRDATGTPVCGILFSRIFSWSKDLAENVRHWQVVQHHDSSLTLQVEVSKPLTAQAHADLQRSFKQYLAGMTINIVEVAELLPGPNGKRRTVIVEK